MQPSGPPGMQPSGPPGPLEPPAPAIRVSDRDRDAAAHVLQAAFAEGRLDDDEFDQRMRAALTAKTHAELDTVLADLPAVAGAPGARPAPVTEVAPGRLAVAYKGTVRRAGR